MKDLRMGCDPGVDLYTAVVDIIEGRLIMKQTGFTGHTMFSREKTSKTYHIE